MDYKTIYEVWKKEVENKELQKIPEDFFQQLSDYVKLLRGQQRMLDEKSVRARLLRVQYERVKRLINELIQIRLDKILDGAKAGSLLTGVCKEEMALCERLAFAIRDYDETRKRVIEGMSLEIERGEGRRVLVKVLKPIPAFIGSDMRRYGPFMEEDIVFIPIENAEVLSRKGIIKRLRLEKAS